MADIERKKGFAALPPERQREIARMGGKAVPAQNRAFSRDRGLAQEAGRKGGKMNRKREKLDPFDRRDLPDYSGTK